MLKILKTFPMKRVMNKAGTWMITSGVEMLLEYKSQEGRRGESGCGAEWSISSKTITDVSSLSIRVMRGRPNVVTVVVVVTYTVWHVKRAVLKKALFISYIYNLYCSWPEDQRPQCLKRSTGPVLQLRKKRIFYTSIYKSIPIYASAALGTSYAVFDPSCLVSIYIHIRFFLVCRHIRRSYCTW